jgi:hypothetical protein
MKTAKELTREQLEAIVTTAQKMFWSTYEVLAALERRIANGRTELRKLGVE